MRSVYRVPVSLLTKPENAVGVALTFAGENPLLLQITYQSQSECDRDKIPDAIRF